MEAITHNTLPDAVAVLINRVANIERLLLQKTESSPETERWLNLTEFCEYHPEKPAKPTVYGWISKGDVPSRKRGKKLYFLKSEIDNWLKEGRKKTNIQLAGEIETRFLVANKKRGRVI